ncbi:MAG: hypothetical protein LBV41_03060 [Cytophagaceae bacterium]|nr:hypothetical protein [Cytophagaceae bacterium]
MKIGVSPKPNFSSVDFQFIIAGRQKNGTFPVKIRITHKHNRKYYSTGKYLSF